MSLERAFKKLEANEMPMGPDIGKARLVILSDGGGSGENRSLGLAEALGHADPEIVVLRLRAGGWWQPLAGILPVRWWVLNFDELLREVGRCEVVLGSGALVGRVLGELKVGIPELFVVALGWQAKGVVRRVDVVSVAQHEGLAKVGQMSEKIVVTLGYASRMTQARLRQETERWGKRLAHVAGPMMRGPKVAIVLGEGASGGEMKPADVREILEPVMGFVRLREGAILLSATAGTGVMAFELAQGLLERGKVAHYAWAPGQDLQRDSPTMAFLGLADVVLVSATSPVAVNDAVSAGRPVLLWGKPEEVPRKIRPFYAALVKQWRLAWWDGSKEMLFHQRPPAAGVMDTAMVAGFVRARWGKRG